MVARMEGVTVTMIAIEEIAPRTRRRFDIAVELDHGAEQSTLPVHVLVGHQYRPCLALVAGVHGDEYDGILALQDMADEIETMDLLGTLIIIPVANPFAFAAAQRHTPQDGLDLNRVFPGRAEGALSERLAHLLCTDPLRQATLILTLHGGGCWTALAPWIEFLDTPDALGSASYAAARGSGFPDLIALPKLPGILLSAMADLGVPVVEGEVGGRGATTSRNVAYAKERAYAVARHAGVLPARDTPRDHAPAVWRLCFVTSGATGMFLRAVELKHEVRQGALLGRIVDIAGAVVAEIRAPRDGMVGAYREHAGVQPDDQVVILWSPVEEGYPQV